MLKKLMASRINIMKQLTHNAKYFSKSFSDKALLPT
jgi:hypothetical protein